MSRLAAQGVSVKLRRFGSVTEFMAAAGELLGAREAEHNLIFGICAGLEADAGDRSSGGNSPSMRPTS